MQKQTATKNDVAVVGTLDRAGGPMLWVDHLATRYHLTLGAATPATSTPASSPSPATGSTSPPPTTAPPPATTSTACRSRAVRPRRVGSSNSWRIGAYGGNPGGFFDGVIDDVRIYNRALTAAEIHTDMSQPVPAAGHDRRRPRPARSTATRRLGRSTLSWGAATRQHRRDRYNVHRSTTSGFTPSPANRIAQPTGTSYTDTGLAAGTYYYKVTAEDAAGNVGAASNEASAAVPADTTPPTVSITSPADGATLAASSTVTADAADGQGVAASSSASTAQNLGAEDTAAPYSVAWDTRGERERRRTR